MRNLMVFFIVMLSGCAGATEEETTIAADAISTVPQGTQLCIDPHERRVPPTNGTCPSGTASTVEPIDHDGQLGAHAYVCHTNLPECQGQTVTPDTCDVRIEHVGWTLVAGNVTATWIADTPAAQELTLDVMVMNASVYEMLGTVTGPSPLIISFAGLNRSLAAGDVVHFYAYNPKGFVGLPGGGAFASADQAVHLGGNLTYTLPNPTR